MKKTVRIIITLLCLTSLMCCNPYSEEIVEMKKLSSSNAYFFSRDNDEYSEAYKMAECLYDKDSLCSYIAHNFQYPFDLLGDSVELGCEGVFDIDTKGEISKIREITINDYHAALDEETLEQVSHILKTEAERVVKNIKFRSQSMCYDSITCKWNPDTFPLNIRFSIVPYPVEKVHAKDAVLYYLHQCKTYWENNNDGWGGKPVGWILQQKFAEVTSAKEKILFALNCENPLIRVTAFNALINEKNPECVTVINEAIKDTAYVSCQMHDMGNTEYIADLMLGYLFDTFHKSGKLCSDKDSIKIDAIVFFSPKVAELAYKYSLINELKPTPERYERTRELYLNENYTHALVLLAKYRKEQDKQFIIDALNSYYEELEKKEESDDPEEIIRKAKVGTSKPYNKYYDDYEEALQAIKFWPDEAFVPLIEKTTYSEMKNNGHYSHGALHIFEVVMAYENDWAYNFIENCFSKRNAPSYFKEALFNAYYESDNPHKLFLPLVEKYGKKSFRFENK